MSVSTSEEERKLDSTSDSSEDSLGGGPVVLSRSSGHDNAKLNKKEKNTKVEENTTTITTTTTNASATITTTTSTTTTSTTTITTNKELKKSTDKGSRSTTPEKKRKNSSNLERKGSIRPALVSKPTKLTPTLSRVHLTRVEDTGAWDRVLRQQKSERACPFRSFSIVLGAVDWTQQEDGKDTELKEKDTKETKEKEGKASDQIPVAEPERRKNLASSHPALTSTTTTTNTSTSTTNTHTSTSTTASTESALGNIYQLYQQYFDNYPNVVVSDEDPFEVYDSYDAIVIPCTCFGQPIGPLATAYFDELGSRFQSAFQKKILEDYFGEQPVGSAVILESMSTLPTNYVILSAVSRTNTPKTECGEIYNAFRGIFLAVHQFNGKSSSTISKILFPSFGLDDASAEHRRLSVQQMSLAYRHLYYPRDTLLTEEEALVLERQMGRTSNTLESERRAEILNLVNEGALAKRGIFNEEELLFLLEFMMSKDEALIKKTCVAICAILSDSHPQEFTLTREIICAGIVKSPNAVQSLLQEAFQSHLQIYTEISPKELQLEENIGDGTEASVWKSSWHKIPVAVKKFRGIPNRPDFIRELSIMSLCQHPNLVQCYGGATTNEEEYMIVTELMDGNLFDTLQNLPEDSELSREKIVKIALDVAKGMEFLHSCNLIHRDLKSNNLLVKEFNTSNLQIKVCDFGLSRVVDRSRNMTGNVGTIAWIAPEIFEKKQYTEKCDVYSYGIILWELFFRKVPFADISSFEIPVKVAKEGLRPKLTPDVPKSFAKLMKQCWSSKPSKRPSFKSTVKVLTKLYDAWNPLLEKQQVTTTSSSLLGKIADGRSSGRSSIDLGKFVENKFKRGFGSGGKKAKDDS